MKSSIMPLLKAALLLLFAFGLPATISAQEKWYLLPDTSVAKLRSFDRKHNASFIGMTLPDFTATMEDGRLLNNASMKGKVSLLVFWYPNCNCFDPKNLGALPELAKLHKDFQIISIVSDTGGMAQFRRLHDFVGQYANVHSEMKSQELNGRNGFPSCVLVNRDGSIALSSGMLHRNVFDELAFADKIKELLMF